MKSILFILENLSGGGAERVLPNLLKYLNKDKYKVTVLTLFDGGINEKRIPNDITYICRNAPCFRGVRYICKFLPSRILYKYYVRKAFPKTEFDVLIAYMHGIPTKIISGASDAHKITWIHGNMMGGYVPPLRKVFVSFDSMLLCLKKLDAIVGVSKQVCDSFIKYTGITERVHLIHNTNDVEEIERKANENNPYTDNGDIINIVTVGHLQKVKGNDLLLEAVLKLKSDGLKFHVTILGEGDERERLEMFVRENGLAEMVSMPGFIDNPYTYIKNADMYVCPSRSEGFSTAVSEALILGVPVVSTRVSGAEEMLGENDEYGIVCESSADGIYSALKRMLTTPSLRAHYAEQASKRREFFSPTRTVGDVERLIESVCNNKQSPDSERRIH